MYHDYAFKKDEQVKLSLIIVIIRIFHFRIVIIIFIFFILFLIFFISHNRDTSISEIFLCIV